MMAASAPKFAVQQDLLAVEPCAILTSANDCALAKAGLQAADFDAFVPHCAGRSSDVCLGGDPGSGGLVWCNRVRPPQPKHRADFADQGYSCGRLWHRPASNVVLEPPNSSVCSACPSSVGRQEFGLRPTQEGNRSPPWTTSSLHCGLDRFAFRRRALDFALQDRSLDFSRPSGSAPGVHFLAVLSFSSSINATLAGEETALKQSDRFPPMHEAAARQWCLR